MNIAFVQKLLGESSFDNGRNKLLANLNLPTVTYSDLAVLAHLYSFDSGRNKMLKIFANKSTLIDDGNLCDLLSLFSFDSGKCKAVKILSNMKTTSAYDKKDEEINIVSIISNMSHDSGKIKTLKNLIKNQTNTFKKFNILDVLQLFSHDSSRIKAFKILFELVVDESHVDIVDILKIFSYNSGKKNALDIVFERYPNIKLEGENKISIVMKINPFSLLSRKEEIIKEFGIDWVAKVLSNSVKGVDNYIKIGESYGISPEYLDKYKDNAETYLTIENIRYRLNNDYICVNINGKKVTYSNGQLIVNNEYGGISSVSACSGGSFTINGIQISLD